MYDLIVADTLGLRSDDVLCCEVTLFLLRNYAFYYSGFSCHEVDISDIFINLRQYMKINDLTKAEIITHEKLCIAQVK